MQRCDTRVDGRNVVVDDFASFTRSVDDAVFGLVTDSQEAGSLMAQFELLPSEQQTFRLAIKGDLQQELA